MEFDRRVFAATIGVLVLVALIVAACFAFPQAAAVIGLIALVGFFGGAIVVMIGMLIYMGLYVVFEEWDRHRTSRRESLK